MKLTKTFSTYSKIVTILLLVFISLGYFILIRCSDGIPSFFKLIDENSNSVQDQKVSYDKCFYTISS